MADVFISHSRSGKRWADDFARSLKPYGVATWSDDTLKPGDDIETVLRKALDDSDIVVALLDAEDANNPNVLFEIGAAIGLGKKLFLIVRDKTELNELPLGLTKHQFLVESSPERAAKAVASAVGV